MKKFAAFTLLELMITVAIIAILSVIAIPIYNNYITEARRSDGQTALLDLANRMEQYFTQNNTYATATLANVGAVSPTEGGFYTLTITAADPTSYSLTASPTGVHTDTDCGNLTYNSLSQKGQSGTATDCWGN
jgi:type IV pilus assembly protein PilE